MMRAFSLLLIFLFLTTHSFSQSIQWASDITFQYNQYGDDNYSAKQVIGEPDAKLGTEDPKAYKMKTNSGLGTIVARFANPHIVQQVVVVENYLPGRVSEINLIDEKGAKSNIYKNFAQDLPEQYRILTLKISPTTNKIHKVELKLNTIGKPGWSQIDAIGISELQTPIDVKSLYKSAAEVAATELNTASKGTINFSSDVENLGEKVNTGFTETKPIISADGKTLYFVRQNYTYNVGGKKDDQDIWFSEIRNGNWSYAANMGKPLNNANPNGVSSVSTDGNTLILINEYRDDGSFEPGASVSYRTKDGWSKPEKLNIENFKSKGVYIDFCLASSGKVLIMAINRFDSQGDQDLYVSFDKGDNNWSEPINMGRNLNTSKSEFSPFLAADEKTLFFASDGYDGYGGSDIYYTKRLDNTWKKWSTPVNLGSKINSEDWDGYYSVSAAGDYAYLVSTRNSIGNSKDIYRVGLQKEYKPEPVLLVSGTVYNAKTKEVLGAKILFEALDKVKEQGVAHANPTNGAYKIILPRGKDYSLHAAAKGFLSLEENIDLSDLTEYKEIKKDLYLVPIEVGQKIQLKNIFFVQSQAILIETSFPELTRLAETMKNNPKLEIELAGHTDNQGNADSNLKLSQDRVKVVKEYLVNQGVEGRRVEIKAYGGSKPIASNASEETRKLNRRVEVTVMKFER
jgi:outer membrane protein OmpA-like peptidoglycan-associated protein